MMDIEKLIEQLNDFNENHISVLCGSGQCACGYLCDKDDCIVVRAAATLSTLQAENEKLRNEVERQRRSADDRKHLYENAERAYMKVVAELEQVKAERDALIDDFVDYVTGGVPNPAIFCKNRCDKCTDMRGWCTGKNCKGFYPSGASGQKED